MRNKNYAINICLIPERELFGVCKTLNSLDIESKYNLNSRAYIPHCTLVMKYISQDDVERIINELKNLETEKIETTVGEYYANIFPGDDLWTGIYLEKNAQVTSLQYQICEITKKYKNTDRTQDFYAIDTFFEEKQIPLWTEEDFLSGKHIHITLGKTDISPLFSQDVIPKKCKFEKIVVGHMGNYGSVREILFEKDL